MRLQWIVESRTYQWSRLLLSDLSEARSLVMRFRRLRARRREDIMVTSEQIIGEEVTVLAPREVVWRTLTTQRTWEKWWGGAIQKVVPGWQAGGAIHWERGTPSRIERCTAPEELVLIGASGARSSFRLEPGARGNHVVTSIRYEEDFSHSRLSISDPEAVRNQVRSTLLKLMSCAELEAVRSTSGAVPSPAAHPKSTVPFEIKAGRELKKWWQRLFRGLRLQTLTMAIAEERPQEAEDGGGWQALIWELRVSSNETEMRKLAEAIVRLGDPAAATDLIRVLDENLEAAAEFEQRVDIDPMALLASRLKRDASITFGASRQALERLPDLAAQRQASVEVPRIRGFLARDALVGLGAAEALEHAMKSGSHSPRVFRVMLEAVEKIRARAASQTAF